MDNVKDLPPFFTLPEVIRFLAVAFDTKNKNKPLDASCRRVDTNYRQIEPWISELFEKPLKKQIGHEYSKLYSIFISDLLRDYFKYVANTELDGLSRKQSTSLLLDNYFGIQLTHFSHVIYTEIGGPSPDKLLDETKYSFEVLLEWLNQKYLWFNGFIGTLKKEDKDKINNWSAGREVASRSSIMALFHRPLKSNIEYGTSADWQKVRALLLMARVLDFFRRSGLGKRLVQIGEYALYCPPEKIDFTIIANKLRSKKQNKQKKYISLLFNTLDHVRQLTKTQEDYLKIAQSINEVEGFRSSCDSSGKFDVWRYWIKGRHLVSLGENKKANVQYIKAFQEAMYKVGEFQSKLIEEALSVAAVQGKSGDQHFLKQLKSMGILLGVSLSNSLADRNSTSYSAKDIIDEYEIACLRHHFLKLFPDACLGIEKGGVNETHFGALWFSSKDVNRKPNLKRPDERITLKGDNGRIKKIPQLAYFAMFNKNDEVSALIKAGADVNTLSNDGESALLFALNSMDKTAFPKPAMNTELLDMMLTKDHETEVINKLTLKLKLLPLICAVKTGKLSIVKQILEQGAVVDTRGETDGQTALNICLKLLMQEINPEFCKRETFKHQDSEACIESMKRHCAGLLGSSNAEVRYNLQQQMLLPKYREIQKMTFDYHTQNWGRRYDISELRSIATLLLDSGASPNIEFSAPVDGYTPLMLAAENDEYTLFKYMIEKGGDPLKAYYIEQKQMSVNCFDISVAFNSPQVIGILKEKYGTGKGLWPEGISFLS